jgi:endonuclease VIII
MPEGHTLHRLADLHRRRYAGHPVAVSSPQGRFAASAALVDGRVLERTEAHGKHLFHHYGPGLVVHVHLGLYGTFRDEQLPAAEPVGQVRMRMVGATHYADLRGATACELITDAEAAAVHARLGEDPLRPDADPDRAWARISRSRAPLATLLMDQSVIAGVGNLLADEALWRAGLSPRRPAGELSEDDLDRLRREIRAATRSAIRKGGVHTGDVMPARRRGGICPRCGAEMERATIGGRTTYWCPDEQV